MTPHRVLLSIPITDDRIYEWIVDWTEEETEAAVLDAMLYGNVRVDGDGRYVPWREVAT